AACFTEVPLHLLRCRPSIHNRSRVNEESSVRPPFGSAFPTLFLKAPLRPENVIPVDPFATQKTIGLTRAADHPVFDAPGRGWRHLDCPKFADILFRHERDEPVIGSPQQPGAETGNHRSEEHTSELQSQSNL